jgi:uncharacterized protein (TIRG00374 family)
LKKKIKNSLKFLLFFSVGIFIFWLVYKDQDWDKTWDALVEANYTWIWISLILGLLSHISRAVRWNLLIRPLGYQNKTINSFFSVMIMYLSNMAIPRSGEVVRCGVMSRTEKIPFTKLLGTVVTERIIDFLILFIMLAVVLMTQMHKMIELLNKNPGIKDKIQGFISKTPFIVGGILILIIFIVLLYVYRSKLKKTKLYTKIRDLFIGFWEGIKSILKMKRKFEFIAHSLFIWAMYFLMIYVVFWSFEFTEHLTLLTGLTVFVMSAFGMVFPSPGGVGSWHFAVIVTLMVYGVSEPDGKTFALAAHGSMTLMMIVVGVLSVILLPIVNKEKVELFKPREVEELKKDE